jgi:hypothetical protein
MTSGGSSSADVSTSRMEAALEASGSAKPGPSSTYESLTQPEDTVAQAFADKLVPSSDELDILAPVVAVKTSGDLLLNIPDALEPASKTLYRVSVSFLRRASQYFDRLLDPDKFEEGARVKKAHEQLEREHGGLDTSKLEHTSLPIVDIQDVDPNIPRRGSGPNFSQQDVVTTFFRIIHGKTWLQASVSIPHLACVAVLADRFDAIAAFREGVRKTTWIDIFRKSFNKLPEATEELLRQKLMLAIFLKEYRIWSSLSAKLITQGSSRWEEGEDNKSHDENGLWWDLPCGVEGQSNITFESALTNSVQTNSLLAASALSTPLTPSKHTS